ncbi:glutamate mutase L [Actinocatenispora sera]|uniref:glutamate mutase L n=1 Tax=Actinocatenispora sera TaxID=390989 RepID=UPI0004C33EA7|nr:glutamate mutase L [Actinocatenispora sera]
MCGDVGSTYTKLLAVDLATGTVAGSAEHRTTVEVDVLRGYDACLAALAEQLPGVDLSAQYVCSSAGGGLRLAVVGYEPLVTADAGHRVGLSAGARVVHVAAGPLDTAGVRALRAAKPDVVLLVGGTDGGDAAVLTHNAARLAGTRLRVPVVAAGNADAAAAVAQRLADAGVPVTVTDNVLPRIGQLNPAPARAAIRQVFLSHVIGGKKLSRGARFPRLVRAATPDAVLAGVELLADGAGEIPGAGEILAVDVGGATTDVYSVLVPDAERDGPRREVAGTLWRSRTVEGDLGMRWNAPGILAAARDERLLTDDEVAALAGDADRRAAQPGLLPDSDADRDVDRRLAGLALHVALRRHARGQRRADGSRGPGRDLRQVRLVVGSGGVLRHDENAATVLSAALTDHAGGYPLPTRAASVVDHRYVLAAVGLLATDAPTTAARLAAHHLTDLAVTR